MATWAIGKDRFEELDPTGEKLGELFVQLNGNFSTLSLRSGRARLDAVGFAPDAVEVYVSDDFTSARWHTLVPSGAMLVEHSTAAGSPDRAQDDSLRRAQVAACYFAATSSRSP